MSSEVHTVIPNFNMKPLKLVIDCKESHVAYSDKNFEAQKATTLNNSNRFEKMRRFFLPRFLKKYFCTSA